MDENTIGDLSHATHACYKLNMTYLTMRAVKKTTADKNITIHKKRGASIIIIWKLLFTHKKKNTSFQLNERKYSCVT